jgi:hypothetical protein
MGDGSFDNKLCGDQIERGEALLYRNESRNVSSNDVNIARQIFSCAFARRCAFVAFTFLSSVRTAVAKELAAVANRVLLIAVLESAREHSSAEVVGLADFRRGSCG